MRLLTRIQDSLNYLRLTAKPRQIKTAIIVGAVCTFLLGALLWSPSQPPTLPQTLPLLPSVGTESYQSIVLDQSSYKVADQSEATPLLVKITAIEPTPEGRFVYKLSYTGLETGVFNLTDFLVSPAGDRLKDPIATATIGSAIPTNATFNAVLYTPPLHASAFPYRLTLILGILAWAGCGALLFWPAKKQSPAAGSSPSDPPQTDSPDEIPHAQSLADLLRPLVEKAADKSINADEKAELERILFEYWGKELELDHLNSVEQLRRILEHPEAGALLHTVEQWLYQPDSSITPQEITRALESYLGIPCLKMAPIQPQSTLSETPHQNASNIIAA